MKTNYDWCKSVIERRMHTLIAGCSGSGKSVAMHDIIYTAMLKSPFENMFVMIDTKRVELRRWKDAPHVVRYTNDTNEVDEVLDGCINVMNARFQRMEEADSDECSEPNLWIVIDEWFDVKTMCPKSCIKKLELISSRARACNIFILAGTQRCTKDVLSGVIATNFSVKLGLKTITAQDSRNIIQKKGLEELPRCGKGVLLIDSTYTDIDIPFTTREKCSERVHYWVDLFTKQYGRSKII